MSEILTLAEDSVARAKFAHVIAAQKLTKKELAFLVPDDFVEHPLEPLPWTVGLAETMFLSKFMTQEPPPQHDSRSSQRENDDHVNKAPAEYTTTRYTTDKMLRKFGL
jgi:hypothetical protein